MIADLGQQAQHDESLYCLRCFRPSTCISGRQKSIYRNQHSHYAGFTYTGSTGHSEQYSSNHSSTTVVSVGIYHQVEILQTSRKERVRYDLGRGVPTVSIINYSLLTLAGFRCINSPLVSVLPPGPFPVRHTAKTPKVQLQINSPLFDNEKETC